MRKHAKRIPRNRPHPSPRRRAGRERWGKLRNTGRLPLPGRIDRAPNLGPIAAGDVGHAAVALEELVWYLEDREHEPALRAPSRVAAAGGTPDEVALGHCETGVRTFPVYQLACEHVGLLDLDVLVVGQHRAGRKAHQRGREAAVAIEQQRLHFTAGKPRLLPLHFADANMVGPQISRAGGLLRGHGIHRILLRATLRMIAHHLSSGRIGGWKTRPESHGKTIQVSWDTSVTKVSTKGRPMGLA